MLVSDIINASLRKIGVLSSGEAIESTRQSEALVALQNMLRLWGAVGATAFYTVRESVNLASGKISYTWGDAGDISTARPNSVLGGHVDTETRPINLISEREYRNIATKNTAGQPTSIYVNYTYPLVEFYVYPVTTGDGHVLSVDSLKPFTETSSFATVADTLNFPVYYEEPIICNLALRLAPEYGRVASEDLKSLALFGLNTLKEIHTINKMEFVESILLRAPVGADTLRGKQA
jgi:hypothetical protein